MLLLFLDILNEFSIDFDKGALLESYLAAFWAESSKFDSLLADFFIGVAVEDFTVVPAIPGLPRSRTRLDRSPLALVLSPLVIVLDFFS